MSQTVLFACVHNAGRSQMASAIFNRLADPEKARATSAGTAPAQRVHPRVVQAMDELGVSLAGIVPRRLTPEVAQDASFLITMGCGESCPVVPGVRRDDWPLDDPSGLALDGVRTIRDEIVRRVEALLSSQGWRRPGASLGSKPP